MKRSRIFVFAFLAFLAVTNSACNGSDLQVGDPVSGGTVGTTGSDMKDSSGPAPSASPPSVTGDNSDLYERVLELTNDYRASNGVAPLAANPLLQEAAQAFAESMGTLGFFGHNSPDGATPGDRIQEAGYQWRTWGENIAYGYATAELVMQGWINSAGHRANILNPNFKEIGIGYYKSAKGSGGTAYWVQDFGAQ